MIFPVSDSQRMLSESTQRVFGKFNTKNITQARKICSHQTVAVPHRKKPISAAKFKLWGRGGGLENREIHFLWIRPNSSGHFLETVITTSVKTNKWETGSEVWLHFTEAHSFTFYCLCCRAVYCDPHILAAHNTTTKGSLDFPLHICPTVSNLPL